MAQQQPREKLALRPTAHQLAMQLENALLCSEALTTAVNRFQPRLGDVVLVSPPCCGEDVLGRVLTSLVHQENPSTMKEDMVVPWIESSAELLNQLHHSEEEPKEDKRGTTRRRVVRTQLGMSQLRSWQNRGAKFVVLVQHPLDVRVANFKNLRKACEDPEAFDEQFPFADAFTDVPLSIVQPQAEASSYEQFVGDWVRQKRTDFDTLLVFHESLQAHPRREVARIAEFLAAKKSRDARSNQAGFVSRGDFFDEHGIVSKALVAAGLQQQEQEEDEEQKEEEDVVPKRGSLRQRMFRRSTGGSTSSNGGVSSKFLHGEEGLGGGYFQHGSSVRRIQTYWDANVNGARSYEKLYEQEMKEAYPFPQLALPKDAGEPSSGLQQTIEALRNAMTSWRRSRRKSSVEKKQQGLIGILKQSKMSEDGHDLPATAQEEEEEDACATNPVFFLQQQEASSSSGSNNSSSSSSSAAKTLSRQNSSSTGSSNRQKWATEAMMEAKNVKAALESAGVHHEIVQVVAVREDELSEML